jgi:2-polyprenyl-3-methyl-5-hydroxy-6-metoxy-1,4-benzoquinol methylase
MSNHVSYTTQQDRDLFYEQHGMLLSRSNVQHRSDEYEEKGHDVIAKMQQDHFWYKGRHRFLLKALDRKISRFNLSTDRMSAIDLGAGCGGWINYLLESPLKFRELALHDSSIHALTLASSVVGSRAVCFQSDLMDLKWENRWDVIFLLDVLEHIPEHISVLKQVHKSLKPNGLLFMTAPALMSFWSYNDELSHHQRRYS